MSSINVKRPVNLYQLRRQLHYIYQDYRKALLNCLYNAKQLDKFKKRKRNLDIAVAAGASSGAIAAWPIWQTYYWGKVLWSIYAGIIALIAIANPYLNYTGRIEIYSKQHMGYNDLFNTLKQLVFAIESHEDVNEEMLHIYHDTMLRYDHLSINDDKNPDQGHVDQLSRKVEALVPTKTLWNPPENWTPPILKEGRRG